MQYNFPWFPISSLGNQATEWFAISLALTYFPTRHFFQLLLFTEMLIHVLFVTSNECIAGNGQILDLSDTGEYMKA